MSQDFRPVLAEIARAAAAVERMQAKLVAPILASQEALLWSVGKIAAFNELQERLTADIARIGEQIRSSWLAVQRTLVDPDVLARIFQVWDARQREAVAILAEKGWWLTPDMPLTLLNAVVELKETRQRRRINRLVCDYYTHRRLLALVRKWDDQPLFERRRHIFLQALWAHKQRRWYLTIPLLLTQVDGILQDFAQLEGLPKGTAAKRIAKALHVESTDPKKVISDTWQAQLDAIFGSGYYETEVRQPGLRRNAILHGLELRYASEARSTPLFIQLHTIHWLFSQKASKKAA